MLKSASSTENLTGRELAQYAYGVEGAVPGHYAAEVGMCGFMKLATTVELALVVIEKAFHLESLLPLGGNHTAQIAIVFGTACVLEELFDARRRQVELEHTRLKRQQDEEELERLRLSNLRLREESQRDHLDDVVRRAVREMARKGADPPDAL